MFCLDNHYAFLCRNWGAAPAFSRKGQLMQDNTMPYGSVVIEMGSGEYFLAPGNRLVASFTIANLSGQEDYYDIMVRGIPESWVGLDIPAVHLDHWREPQDRLYNSVAGLFPSVAGPLPGYHTGGQPVYAGVVGGNDSLTCVWALSQLMTSRIPTHRPVRLRSGSTTFKCR